MFSKKMQEAKVVEPVIEVPNGPAETVVYSVGYGKVRGNDQRKFEWRDFIFPLFFVVMGCLVLYAVLSILFGSASVFFWRDDDVGARHALITSLDTLERISISSTPDNNFIIWDGYAPPAELLQLSGLSSDDFTRFIPGHGDVIFVQGGTALHFPFNNQGRYTIVITCERGRESAARFNMSLGLAALLVEE